ncbi:MAG: hypothetical protein J0M24_00630 [Verrucomicrobia bacterium]|nr:hypothetical protein [Verrucomicrobiota bacterium]
MKSIRRSSRFHRSRLNWGHLGRTVSGLLLLFLGFGLGLDAWAEPTRVTVLPITTDDHSYRSWRGAADLGDIIVANLSALPDVTLIERTDLGRIESERALASAGIASPAAQTPLQGAEWAVAIHLGEAAETRRPLRLEVIQLARDQTIFRTNLNLAVPLRSRLSGGATLAGEIAARVREALAAAKQVETRQAGLRRVFWFHNPPWPEPSGWQFIRPEAREATIEESGLAALGLIRNATNFNFPPTDFLVWQPRSGVLEVGNAEASGVFPTNALPAWEEIIGRLQPQPKGSEPLERRAAAALHREALQKLAALSSLEDARSRAAWRDGLSLLGYALWLDPARVEAQELLLRARFAPWVGRVSVHPLRWRYWRREAWGEFVRRHGFETRANDEIEEEVSRADFIGETPTVAWHYVHSAYAVVRSYASGQGFGPFDRWPTDLDSRVLETWWARDLAELRVRLERTASDPELAELRLASADEILVYGAGPDAVGWCRWFETQAPELRIQAGDRWQEQAAETKNQLERLYESAGRAGQHTAVLAVLTKPNPALTRAPSQSGLRLHLPRVSQLDSLAVRPALDAGEIELGPAPLSDAVRTLRLPTRAAILGLTPVTPDERWILAEVSAEISEPGAADPRLMMEPVAGHVRRLLRSRGKGQFELIPSHPLIQSTVGITSHRGELWGFTPTNIWRLASGKDTPRAEVEGLKGPVFGMHAAAGHLLVSGQGVSRWLPEDRRWESLVPQLPSRGPGNEVNLTFQPGQVWVRRFQAMTLPPGGAQALPDALNPPWHAWQSGRWIPLPLPRGTPLQLDATTNAWCVDQGSLRLLTPEGTNLWPEVALRNPVVWRDPRSITQVGEPLPAYLQTREGPGLSFNASGFDTEFTESERESLRLKLTHRAPEGTVLAGSSRLNDPVVGLALVGDYLWLATHRDRVGKLPTTRLTLLHAPTRRWIAAADLPGPLKHWAAGPDGILAVTGDRQGFNREPDQVHAVDVRRLLAVPESAWQSPNPTPAELAKALQSLTGRQRAIRAWAQGDSRPVQALLAGTDPDTAAAEDLFLLATSGGDEARRRQAADVLRRDHPRSLFTAALPVR